MRNLRHFPGRDRRCALLTPLTTFLTSLAVLACLAAVPVEVAASAGLAAVSTPTGPARRWEAGLPVGPFSPVNLRTGRIWTEPSNGSSRTSIQTRQDSLFRFCNQYSH